MSNSDLFEKLSQLTLSQKFKEQDEAKLLGLAKKYPKSLGDPEAFGMLVENMSAKKERIMFRVTPKIKEKAITAAKKSGLKLTEYLALALIEKISLEKY